MLSREETRESRWGRRAEQCRRRIARIVTARWHIAFAVIHTAAPESVVTLFGSDALRVPGRLRVELPVVLRAHDGGGKRSSAAGYARRGVSSNAKSYRWRAGHSWSSSSCRRNARFMVRERACARPLTRSRSPVSLPPRYISARGRRSGSLFGDSPTNEDRAAARFEQFSAEMLARRESGDKKKIKNLFWLWSRNRVVWPDPRESVQ